MKFPTSAARTRAHERTHVISRCNLRLVCEMENNKF